MPNDGRDPQLAQWFAATSQAAQVLEAAAFTDRVMAQTDRLRRRRVIWRVCVAVVMSLVAIPLQDYALALTQVMLVSLIDIQDRLLAQLLAPVNTVGSLFSAVLLGFRLVHKRLFT